MHSISDLYVCVQVNRAYVPAFEHMTQPVGKLWVQKFVISVGLYMM